MIRRGVFSLARIGKPSYRSKNRGPGSGILDSCPRAPKAVKAPKSARHPRGIRFRRGFRCESSGPGPGASAQEHVGVANERRAAAFSLRPSAEDEFSSQKASPAPKERTISGSSSFPAWKLHGESTPAKGIRSMLLLPWISVSLEPCFLGSATRTRVLVIAASSGTLTVPVEGQPVAKQHPRRRMPRGAVARRPQSDIFTEFRIRNSGGVSSPSPYRWNQPCRWNQPSHGSNSSPTPIRPNAGIEPATRRRIRQWNRSDERSSFL
jgi:hypothetical protein